MADSVVEICNLALLRLGGAYNQEMITSLTEDSKAARVCSVYYPQVRDEVLRSHPWNCAVKRADLGAPLSETPEWGYDYAYQLPTNPKCLRVLQMEDVKTQWRREGDKLLTDETEVNILYVARVTDVKQYDSLLVEGIYTKLAAKLATSITDNKRLAGEILEELEKVVLPQARSVDAQESATVFFDTTTLLDARI